MYSIAKLLSRIIFAFFNVLFECYYFFQRRQIVPPPNFDVLLLSATEAAELIRQRKLTSKELISAYITRIKIVNPVINAVVEENFNRAVREACEVDKYLNQLDKNSDEYKMLPKTKPLLGIPFTVKDTFSVKGFRLTAGIVARKNCIAEADSEVVEKVKEAGAILLAITNVPECASHVETNNQLYGRTNNPYDSRRTAGGSSGGEGALIAAAGSIFGIGSDLAGSIRIPAAFNGIYGLKPSEAAISLNGHYPGSAKGYRLRMCYTGPLCRYAKDLSLIFGVMVGKDAAENRFHLSKPVSMSKLRLFYVNGLNSVMMESVTSEIKKTMEKCINYFETKYGNSVNQIELDGLYYALGIFFSSLTETKSGNFSHVLKQEEKDINLVAEFGRKILQQSDHTVATLMVLAQYNYFLNFNPENRKFLEKIRDELRQEIIDLLKDDGILIFPSWPKMPPFHNHMLVEFWDRMYMGIWNALRLPAIVCPLGLNEDGLPLSVQLIAGPDNDRLLIAAANDLEEGFGGWQPPQIC